MDPLELESLRATGEVIGWFGRTISPHSTANLCLVLFSRLVVGCWLLAVGLIKSTSGESSDVITAKGDRPGTAWLVNREDEAKKPTRGLRRPQATSLKLIGLWHNWRWYLWSRHAAASEWAWDRHSQAVGR